MAARVPNRFWLGEELAPSGRSWLEASGEDQLAFYREAAGRVLLRKRREIRKGIGADGTPLAPLSPNTRKVAGGKPLVPHQKESRTFYLFRTRATAKGVEGYWLPGPVKRTGRHWGTILGYHRDGCIVGKLPTMPRRNHFGLSPQGVALVRRGMESWWGKYAEKKLLLETYSSRKKGNANKFIKGFKGFFRREGEGF